MNIWIMRHGEAAFNATMDNQRSLTEYGKTTTFQQGQWLAKRLIIQNDQLDHILVSPYLRAQQTWQEVQKGFQAVTSDQLFTNVETWNGITPAGHPQTVLDYMRVLRENNVKNLLIVSHLPLVYELVSTLTQHQSSVHFYPAVIAEIDWTIDCGKLITSERP
ncbi:phosphohistidine phosphatase SixA [Pasteurella atlantica]|uniref:Phosphohistidine phosphatase SixA n=2 Tax=Pasteurellaceae TaxID=712 RepID=A0ACC6HM35_9PAST|nr:phosphohistidine phosphatase SixA [Pasteurella atlantica]MDP8032680.1 phosphohistidine phosphatase SixA [Pasteurella atlantica]MDP8034814.1 phosphohistidine phosphatase SixA [Pasteurella atlantica]MDP8036764.1 phosphohistidine phosphatase SixA [Pasteurella atlantica]MDP8046914.1 phosphohistidine phosphatase SixA [Pasteurella atlantica]MDP8048867.1 phosphohistidine phosphatase SixA [Pasteurella atlantica]